MTIIKTLIGAIAVLVVIGTAVFFALGQYSKRGEAPGLVDGVLAPCPGSPNCVSSEQETAPDKSVEPLPLESWDLLRDAIGEMGGVVTKSNDAYVSAVFTSATMGFVDDLELRKTNDTVHVRSASRVGYSDAGANAKRVAELRSRLP